MTEVIISTSAEESLFEVTGHTGYQNPSTGENDVCVAVSTLVGMFGQWLERQYGIYPVHLGEGHAKFEIRPSNVFVNEILTAIEIELRTIANEHPCNLKVF